MGNFEFEKWFEENETKIDSIINLINKHQYSSGERILKEVKELLK